MAMTMAVAKHKAASVWQASEAAIPRASGLGGVVLPPSVTLYLQYESG
jgi:hypothetical protein